MNPKDLDKFIDEDKSKKMDPQVEQIVSQLFEATDPKLIIDSAEFSTVMDKTSSKFMKDEDLVSISMYINKKPKGRDWFRSSIDLKRNLMFVNGVHPYDLTNYHYAYCKLDEFSKLTWNFVAYGANRMIVGKPLNTNDIYDVCLKLEELDSTKTAHIDTW